MSVTLQDEQLLQQIRTGNKQAMEILIRRHYPQILRYLYQLTGNYDLACDLTQETCLKILRHFHQLRDDSRFIPWMLRIASNVSRDYYKSAAYQVARHSDEWKDDHTTQTLPSNTITSFHDWVSKQSDRLVLQEALLALRPEQRESIILRYYHDLKLKDIAQVTDVPEPTIRSRLKQGLLRLKSFFERSESENVPHTKKRPF